MTVGRAAPHTSRVVLLGPQDVRQTLPEVVRELGLSGTVATVTAGWRDSESEDEELQEQLAGRAAHLRLWERTEELFAADEALRAAYRERQDRLRALQGVYRIQLAHALEALRELMAAEGARDILDPARAQALEALRKLDLQHRERIRALHEGFELSWGPSERDSVRQQRAEIERQVEQSSAIVIAGGHVLVLLNRMRLLGLDEMLMDKPVIAWSAGAMALAEQVVVFHDSPPQGRGDAEVIEVGLGLVRGVLPLPHARSRLAIHDPARMSIFARRFAPLICVPMDEGARLDLARGELKSGAGLSRVAPDGALESF